MITGWLVKLVLGIAAVGFLLVEVGTPIIVRSQLDGLAHEAADSAAADYRDRSNPESAKVVAEEIAAKDEAALEKFEIDGERRVHVTLRKEARSYLLKKWDRLKGWYDVSVSATSEGRR